MLYISNQQLAEIERTFELYKSKQFHMPDRLYVDREEGSIQYMPCFTDTVSAPRLSQPFLSHDRPAPSHPVCCVNRKIS